LKEAIKKVTERIIEKSKTLRAAYLDQMMQAEMKGVNRETLSCGNQAHAFAGCGPEDKEELVNVVRPNIGIVTAYNDMLSAHKTYENYPDKIRKAALKHGAVAQVAGGVPAMCDGVTQGQPGMELSLFSRDVIALSTAVSLSHATFDAGMCLGICDKIVPGLLIGSLRFGHLPIVFVPGGPMQTGISNDEKAQIRRDYAEGKISREALLKGEMSSYHSPGTCTFYGTANSNQMLMEIMGLQLPGSSFVNPDSKLRDALTEEAVRTAKENSYQGAHYTPLYKIINEKTIVNGLVGLLATGGSTNHTIHMIAIARAAGIIIDWTDFSDLSEVVPSICKIYPNGKADVNHFQASGGMTYLIKTLLENGMLHEDVTTIKGEGLSKYTKEPYLENGNLEWRYGVEESIDQDVLRSASNPFEATGGLKILSGNIGRSVIKTSAVAREHYIVEAPALVFEDQNEIMAAFDRKELNRDFIAVLRYQGPSANGMPELHKLTPILGILQFNKFKVALVTDGRMSGASGKVPSAIHLSPEGLKGGIISKLQDGDMLRLDAEKGELTCLNIEEVLKRPDVVLPHNKAFGYGRELFQNLRDIIGESEEGASILF
jgi:phosphogluconate dehydratase